MGEIWDEMRGRKEKTGRERGNGVNWGGDWRKMGTKGGPEWGLSCQEGFELLGEVLGAAEWGYGGNRLKLGRIWG